MYDKLKTLSEMAEVIRTNLKGNEKFFNKLNLPNIIGDHRFLSVADYIETKDPNKFKEHLKKATHFQIQLFERYREGQDIPVEARDATRFKDIFHPLAAGDWELTKKLVKEMSSISLEEIDSGLPFYFNILFKNLILDVGLDKDINEIIKEFEDQSRKEYCHLTGYIYAFSGIYNQDKTEFSWGIELIVNEMLVWGNSMDPSEFNEDEILSIPALAMINLARMKGLEVRFDNEITPMALYV